VQVIKLLRAPPPPSIGMAKALASAGYKPAEITTIIKPFARPGKPRARARNTINRHLDAKSKEQLYPTYRIPSDVSQAAASLAEIFPHIDPVAALPMEELERVAAEMRRSQEAHLRFIAGSNTDVHIVRLPPAIVVKP